MQYALQGVPVCSCISVLRDFFLEPPPECDPDNGAAFFRGLRPCPCAPPRGNAAWKADIACGGFLPSFLDCGFHPGADECFRTRTNGNTISNQCCYTDGMLNTNTQTGAAGSADCRSDFWPHQLYDVIPVKFFVDLPTYYRYRPVIPQGGCEPEPEVGGGNGDPHYFTGDRLEYTFNGCGEYVHILTSPGTAVSFEIQARMEPLGNGAVFTAFAFVANGGRAVEVATRGDRLQVLFEGGEITFLDQVPEAALGNLVVSSSNGPEGPSVLVAADGVFSATVSLRGALLAVVEPNAALFGQLEGLLGDFDGDPLNDLRARNGTVVPADSTQEEFYPIGETWAVPSAESLFYSSGTPGACVGYAPTFLDLDDLTVIPQEVRDLCEDNQQCIFDLLATGEESVALGTRNASVEVVAAQTLAAEPEPIFCPTPAPVPNGLFSISSLGVGGNLTLLCDPEYMVFGVGEATCTDSGVFEPSTIGSCVPVVPDTDLCVGGVMNKDGSVCCCASCGTCGGCTCADQDGGADRCCPSAIARLEFVCTLSTDCGCLLGEYVPETPSDRFGCDV